MNEKGQWFGAVGREVASHTRNPRFESGHRKYSLLSTVSKDENKEKVTGNGPIFTNEWKITYTKFGTIVTAWQSFRVPAILCLQKGVFELFLSWKWSYPNKTGVKISKASEEQPQTCMSKYTFIRPYPKDSFDNSISFWNWDHILICSYTFLAKAVKKRSTLEKKKAAETGVGLVPQNLKPQMEKNSKFRLWFGWFWKRKSKQQQATNDAKSPQKKIQTEIGQSSDEKTDQQQQQTKTEIQTEPELINDPYEDSFDDVLLEDDSEILSKCELIKLGRSLPPRLLCCSWKKTFYSARDGFRCVLLIMLARKGMCITAVRL